MKFFYYLLLLVAIGMLTLPQARAVDGTWKDDNSGDWSDPAMWVSGTVPGGAGSEVNLTYNITANRKATIDTPFVTTGTLNIDSGSTIYNMVLAPLVPSGTNYLLMDNGVSEAEINLGTPSSSQRSNAHLVTAPIRMTANGLVVKMYGGNINIGDGGISSTTTGTTVLRVATGSGNPYFAGVISDGDGVNQVVAFLNDTTDTTFLLSANTFTGGVTVQRGSVKGNNDAAFGTGTITLGTASSTGTVILSNQATHTYANNILVSSTGTSATAKISTPINNSNITYTGNIEMQRALTVASEHVDGLTTFSGTISGAGNLTALSGATSKGVILSGSNIYTGETKVSGGTLLINGDNSAATGAVTATGASALLGGTGTIGGAVTVKTSATLAAGGTNTGILTVANDVTIETTGIFSARINGATAGTEYDRLVLTGAGSDFSLTSSNDLELTLGSYTAPANALFFLVDLDDDSNTLTGAFASLNTVTTDLTQGALFTVNGQDFQISYTGDRVGNTFLGGNDLVIQAVPEPTTGLLLVAGLTALAALRRRRV